MLALYEQIFHNSNLLFLLSLLQIKANKIFDWVMKLVLSLTIANLEEISLKKSFCNFFEINS